MARRTAVCGEHRPLLDVEGLAEWLGVEVVFVRRLVSERRVPFVKIGKYVRFEPDKVAAWIGGQRVAPTVRWSSRTRRSR
jgi:excisionase family DNA binding protein